VCSVPAIFICRFIDRNILPQAILYNLISHGQARYHG